MLCDNTFCDYFDWNVKNETETFDLFLVFTIILLDTFSDWKNNLEVGFHSKNEVFQYSRQDWFVVFSYVKDPIQRKSLKLE